MELDLDSFIDSQSNTTDDDENYEDYQRTVDEILLNNSDSPSSSPSSPNQLSSGYKVHPVEESYASSSEKVMKLNAQSRVGSKSSDFLLDSIETLPIDENSVNYLEMLMKSNSQLQSRFSLKSGEFPSGSMESLSVDATSVNYVEMLRQSNSKFINKKLSLNSGEHSVGGFSLFGGVRSNAKPGAALAAAAAASRSIPTPHAAAIKLKRAGTGGFVNLLDNEESVSKPDFEGSGISNGDSSGHGDDISQLEEDDKFDDFQIAEVNLGAKVEEEVSKQDMLGLGNLEDNSPRSNHEEDSISLLNVDESQNLSNGTTLVSNDGSLNDDECQNLNNGTLLVTNDGTDDYLRSLTATETDGVTSVDELPKVEEDLTYVVSETHDLENVIIPESKEGDDKQLVEDIIQQWESKRGGQRERKKSHASIKPLDLAEELEKKHSFKGLHWEEGAAAQPMRLEGVRRGSIVLGYFDIDANNLITRTISSQTFRRDHGSPQVIAVHLNFIALGMSKGVIVVVPSKYSPHHVDHMDAKMLMLGLQADRSNAPVTSMCFNLQGELLFAGYGDGHYTVWDVQRASVVKIMNEHKAPVVHMLYLGQDYQVTRNFTVVSGDSKGVVKLIRFSAVPWLNRFTTSKPMTLLDESTSTVVCASPLLPDEGFGGSQTPSQGNTAGSTSGISSMMGGVVGGDWKLFEGSSLVEEGVVIFVTHQSALVAKVNPKVEVYTTLPKPDGVREGSMPYTAWKYMAQNDDSSTENEPVKASDRVPLLAIAWDRKVQVAKLVKSELKIYGNWTLDSPAVGVAWLDDQMLVVLTLAGQLCLFAKDGTVIHQTSFAVDGSRGDDLIAYHTYFNNIYGNPEKAYHNCIAVRGASIYILGPMHLVVSRLLPWKERIEVLRKAGDWMGALNMAMTLYDGQSHGVIDLPRNLEDVQKAVMPYLVELLYSYVDEVFSYISVAFCKQSEKQDQSDEKKSAMSHVSLEEKDQYTRVGGVAVEFCVHIKRTDILFEEILSRFNTDRHKETFLELLEPYILKDMLGSLPPEIMQALVEHYSEKGWLQRVEQCVLHMDISSLDFNQVVRLCREHRLYGALIYLFNKGLDDFRAPLEDLLAVLRNSERESAPSLGYRILVYLKYCFSGLAFPPGHGTLPPTRLPSLRIELIQFLLEDSDAPNLWSHTSLSMESYPNLYHLLELDTEATLDVLRHAFVEDEIAKLDHPLDDSADALVENIKENGSLTENENLVQKIVNVLTLILDKCSFKADESSSSDDVKLKELWPSRDDMGHLFEFIAFYVSCESAIVSKGVLSCIFEYLTSENNVRPGASMHNNDTLRRREKQVLALLDVVDKTHWDASHLLNLCENAQFYQVCGLIHSTRQQYLAALDSYMKDANEPLHAFSFINDTLLRLSDNDSDGFKSSVISRIPELVKLSRECTFFLVIDHFSQENQRLLSELHNHPESLFLYLKTVIEVQSTGTLNFSCLRKGDNVDSPGGQRVRAQSGRVEAYLERISDPPKFLRNNPVHVTDEMIELYLELLCQYEPNSVLSFLKTFESYRVDHCLRLCQEYGIIDASVFLFERVDEVGSALLLTLSGLNDKFLVLDATVKNVMSDAKVADHFNTILKEKEVIDILDILHACIGLCQRNSPRLDPEEAESLWFQLLDSFCEPLIDSYNGKTGFELEKDMGSLAEPLGRKEDEEGWKIKWKFSSSHKGAYILRKLFSMCIKEIVEGMIGYIRLPSIMLKLLSDNGSQEFGDFKPTILGMLGTYDFERRILDTAKSLIEDDTFYTMSLLKKGASHGYGPQSLLCCICNCLLSKNSSLSSVIQVFNCGHAAHLSCQEKEASHTTGCPVCMPKKKANRSKTKLPFAENDGLVSKPSSKHQISQGTIALHPHESDAFENSYGFPPISRFEILTNLQKDKRLIQIENIPQLRLAPPAVYHEKVKKQIGSKSTAESSSSPSVKQEKPSKIRQLRDLKVKGSSIRFPLKSTIFGKEKTVKR